MFYNFIEIFIKMIHNIFNLIFQVDPSEGDQMITSKLGDFSTAKALIENRDNIIGISGCRRPLPPPPSMLGLAPPHHQSIPGNRLPLSQQSLPPPHHYQQQQIPRPTYMKQADNKPAYNGRGGYPGQPIKNDIRSSSGMAPPKGPPLLSSSALQSSQLPTQQFTQPQNVPMMPNGRIGGVCADKSGGSSSSSFLGPPNGRFPQPSIPKMRPKFPMEVLHIFFKLINNFQNFNCFSIAERHYSHFK